MTAYRVGDIPPHPLTFEPAFDDGIELSDFTTAVVTVGTTALATSKDGDTVTAAWPPLASLFIFEGVYPVTLTLTGTVSKLTVDDESIVAEDPKGWHSLDSARREWTTGAPDDDVQLFELLQIARDQVIEYAPALANYSPVQYEPFNTIMADDSSPGYYKLTYAGDPIAGSGISGPVPVNYRKAQVMQARNLWNATKSDGDSINADGILISAKPLDWHVKNLLRPKRGLPVIF